MIRDWDGRTLRCFYLTAPAMIAAAGLTACGSSSTADFGSVTPTIVGVKLVGSGVQVRYRAPGATGGEWPVLRISVRKADDALPPTSEFARPVEQEGTVVVPIETEQNQDLAVYGSVVYEEGRRVYLPEKIFRP